MRLSGGGTQKVSAGRPSKRRISTGVYRDAYGIEARVQVGSGKTAQVASKRYPSNAPLTVIKKWQDEKRRELKLCRPRSRHTLAHDAERYYRFIAPLASWRERRSEIRAWVALYGDTHAISSCPRMSLTHVQSGRTRDGLQRPSTTA